MFVLSAGCICRAGFVARPLGCKTLRLRFTPLISYHIAPHDEVIVSERTARLMQSRLPGGRTEHVLPFGERRTVRGFDLMLLPAGHIFGSAQCFLFAGDETLLYTGDFKLRPGKSAEQAEWRQADTSSWTTFGLPRYRFPPTERLRRLSLSAARQSIRGRCLCCWVTH